MFKHNKNQKTAIAELESTVTRLEATVKERAADIDKYRMYVDTVFQIGKKSEDFIEYRDNNIVLTDEDCRPIACYLPQFHAIPENDEWWGKGFTEWTNVTKAAPHFPGHYQPHLPLESFYDLTNIEVMKRQVKLAKNYGIFGFMFHYYWFSGKRILEKPLETYLNTKDGLDFPFCINWANHSWTKVWDGCEEDVIMKQEHSEEDDLACIQDISRYMRDDRYIRVKGKPLISIFNPAFMPDAGKTAEIWRSYCKQNSIGEIHLVGIDLGMCNPFDYGFDGAIAQAPHDIDALYGKDLCRSVASMNENTTCYVYDIDKYIDGKAYLSDGRSDFYRGIIPTFDNTARRTVDANIIPVSPWQYKRWLRDIICSSKSDFESGNRFVFINAWNEWAEGAHLEPDRKYGFAYLQATAEAIEETRKDTRVAVALRRADALIQSKWDISEFTGKVAVQAHVYYVDLADEIIESINCIPVKYDLYISTDTEEKRKLLLEKFTSDSNAENISVEAFENKGRDIAPFLTQMRGKISQYDYLCHIHTKKSTGIDRDGDEWRKYLYRHLFGDAENAKSIFQAFIKDASLGIMFPRVFPPLLGLMLWGANKDNTDELLKRINAETKLTDELIFPAGNMFWARTDAVRNIFNIEPDKLNFQEETGQEDGTLAHAVERHWVYAAQANGYGYIEL